MVIPLSLLTAQEWAEEHLDGEDYERIFGMVEEDKTQIATWIENSVKSRADALKEAHGYTLKDIFVAGVQALESK